MKKLTGKTIFVTGAAKRIGRELALAAACEGADIILHYRNSKDDALSTKSAIETLGTQCILVQADFSDPEKGLHKLSSILSENKIDGLVNNASMFRQNHLLDASLADWNAHFAVNLTIPFLLTQAYANSPANHQGKIINMLDWRALRPGYDHFAYTISKAGLVSLTEACALALAPNFQVNGLALGAILPPSDGGDSDTIINSVPARRWADMEEITETFLFLLTAPTYLTGEIIHIDGGRHLV
ncbi:MAG: SDR family oxidoreductase [Chloroflexi bacterium]|nr:SDR family oxidoreductase [Chloroflexota bacterium]